MDKSEIKRRLEDHLFAEPEEAAFAMLDGALWRGMRGKLEEADAAFECLHAGDLDPEVLAVSPYLVHLDETSDLFDTLFEECWGRARGIFLRGRGSLSEMRGHLRDLAYARMPDGEVTLFRFYDPRALEPFMAVATPAQVEAIFGERVACIVAEDADGEGGGVYAPGSNGRIAL